MLDKLLTRQLLQAAQRSGTVVSQELRRAARDGVERLLADLDGRKLGGRELRVAMEEGLAQIAEEQGLREAWERHASTSSQVVESIVQGDSSSSELDTLERALQAGIVETEGEVEAEVLKPGDVIDSKFLILDLLGGGGVGWVYKARDVRFGNVVAIKVLRRSRMSHERLREEFQVLTRLRTHENIVSWKAFEQTADGIWYLVMEFIDGEELQDVLDFEPPMKSKRAARLLLQMAKALSVAHHPSRGEGVLHLDLKPSNIFVVDEDGEERLKIIDFGLGRIVTSEGGWEDLEGEELESGGSEDIYQTIGCTPQYASPEQCALFCRGRSRQELDERSDIYSFGVVAYQMLTGELPFDLEGMDRENLLLRRVSLEARSLSDADMKVHRRLRRLVERCLELDPDDRLSDSRELVTELEPIVHPSRTPMLIGLLALVGTGAVYSSVRDARAENIQLVLTPVDDERGAHLGTQLPYLDLEVADDSRFWPDVSSPCQVVDPQTNEPLIGWSAEVLDEHRIRLSADLEDDQVVERAVKVIVEELDAWFPAMAVKWIGANAWSVHRWGRSDLDMWPSETEPGEIRIDWEDVHIELGGAARNEIVAARIDDVSVALSALPSTANRRLLAVAVPRVAGELTLADRAGNRRSVPGFERLVELPALGADEEESERVFESLDDPDLAFLFTERPARIQYETTLPATLEVTLGSVRKRRVEPEHDSGGRRFWVDFASLLQPSSSGPMELQLLFEDLAPFRADPDAGRRTVRRKLDVRSGLPDPRVRIPGAKFIDGRHLVESSSFDVHLEIDEELSLPLSYELQVEGDGSRQVLRSDESAPAESASPPWDISMRTSTRGEHRLKARVDIVGHVGELTPSVAVTRLFVAPDEPRIRSVDHPLAVGPNSEPSALTVTFEDPSYADALVEGLEWELIVDGQEPVTRGFRSGDVVTANWFPRRVPDGEYDVRIVGRDVFDRTFESSNAARVVLNRMPPSVTIDRPRFPSDISSSEFVVDVNVESETLDRAWLEYRLDEGPQNVADLEPGVGGLFSTEVFLPEGSLGVESMSFRAFALDQDGLQGESNLRTVSGLSLRPYQPHRLRVELDGHPMATMRLVEGNSASLFWFGGRSPQAENEAFEAAGSDTYFTDDDSWSVRFDDGQIPDFYLDVDKVTVGEFLRFLETPSGYGHAGHWVLGGTPDRASELRRSLTGQPAGEPVVGLSVFEAAAFAHWTGRRLPSIVELEYALRGGSQYAVSSWTKGADVTPDGIRHLCSGPSEWSCTWEEQTSDNIDDFARSNRERLRGKQRELLEGAYGLEPTPDALFRVLGQPGVSRRDFAHRGLCGSDATYSTFVSQLGFRCAVDPAAVRRARQAPRASHSPAFLEDKP